MNLSGIEQVEQNAVNVVSLFGNLNQDVVLNDPMTDLLDEGMLSDNEEEVEEIKLTPRKIVTENQFPDQSIFVLEEQLTSLKSSLNRIKFYLGDVDDLLLR